MHISAVKFTWSERRFERVCLIFHKFGFNGILIFLYKVSTEISKELMTVEICKLVMIKMLWF